MSLLSTLAGASKGLREGIPQALQIVDRRMAAKENEANRNAWIQLQRDLQDERHLFQDEQRVLESEDRKSEQRIANRGEARRERMRLEHEADEALLDRASKESQTDTRAAARILSARIQALGKGQGERDDDTFSFLPFREWFDLYKKAAVENPVMYDYPGLYHPEKTGTEVWDEEVAMAIHAEQEAAELEVWKRQQRMKRAMDQAGGRGGANVDNERLYRLMDQMGILSPPSG